MVDYWKHCSNVPWIFSDFFLNSLNIFWSIYLQIWWTYNISTKFGTQLQGHVCVQKHGNFHWRLPKSQNPGVIPDPDVWIAITPKKGAYSSSTDLISVRPDQGVVHDHTIPNKWSISGTNLYKVSGTLYNEFSSSGNQVYWKGHSPSTVPIQFLHLLHICSCFNNPDPVLPNPGSHDISVPDYCSSMISVV